MTKSQTPAPPNSFSTTRYDAAIEESDRKLLRKFESTRVRPTPDAAAIVINTATTVTTGQHRRDAAAAVRAMLATRRSDPPLVRRSMNRPNDQRSLIEKIPGAINNNAAGIKIVPTATITPNWRTGKILDTPSDANPAAVVAHVQNIGAAIVAAERKNDRSRSLW